MAQDFEFAVNTGLFVETTPGSNTFTEVTVVQTYSDLPSGAERSVIATDGNSSLSKTTRGGIPDFGQLACEIYENLSDPGQIILLADSVAQLSVERKYKIENAYSGTTIFTGWCQTFKKNGGGNEDNVMRSLVVKINDEPETTAP